IEPHLNEASNAQRARFAALTADQVYLKQRSEKWDSRDNHELVLKFYGRARELEHTFKPVQMRRWTQTLIALDRETEALAFIDTLQPIEGSPKHALVRQMIERRMEGRGDSVDPVALAPLLERYKQELRLDGDRQVRREGAIWLATFESQLLLDVNSPDAALDELMIRFQRLNAEGGDGDLAPLFLQLGKAQLRMGLFEEAQR